MDNNDTVIIQLDRPRELRLSHKVLKKFMAAHDASMADFGSFAGNYDVTVELLLMMLQREDPSLTAEQLDDLLDAPNVKIGDVIQKVTEAAEAAFGTPEENANPPKRPARGTGRKV